MKLRRRVQSSSTNYEATTFRVHIAPASPLHSSAHANSHCDLTIASNLRFERRWVHGHSGGVYPVPSRTRKSSPSASVPVLWCESPREWLSLCPSLFLGEPPHVRLRANNSAASCQYGSGAAFSRWESLTLTEAFYPPHQG